MPVHGVAGLAQHGVQLQLGKRGAAAHADLLRAAQLAQNVRDGLLPGIEYDSLKAAAAQRGGDLLKLLVHEHTLPLT